jgi:hypothetical protein
VDETETGSANFFGPAEAAGVEWPAKPVFLGLDITPVIVHRIEIRVSSGFQGLRSVKRSTVSG